MTPFFLFLFIGIILGLATGLIKHEDWIGFVADVEMGSLGAIMGGMAFVLITHQMENVAVEGLVISFFTALVFLVLVKRLIYTEPKEAHR